MSRIRIGVIGAGRWGPNLIRNFYANPKSFLISIAEKDEGRRKMLANHYTGVSVTDDAAAVIGNPEIEAIIIATPTDTHYELAKAALQKGKHVFVEKPLAKDPEQCRELVELSEKSGKVLFVGHVFVYNASIRAMRGYLNDGTVGTPYYMTFTRSNLGPVRTDVSALWDLASHDLSILHYWLGKMPERVSAVGGRFLGDKVKGVEDVVFATYTFPGNLIANIHVSWLSPKKIREILVVGDKKALIWDDMNLNQPITIFDKGVSVDRFQQSVLDTFVAFRANIHEGDTLIPKIQLNEPLQAECAAFLEAIANPSSSLSTGRHGMAVVEALAASDESLRSGGREIAIRYR